MTGWLRLFSVVYWTGLVFWIGGLLSGGIAAPAVFGTLPEMSVVLAEYSDFPQDQHGRLAAGKVMEPLFALAALIQFGGAAMVLFSLIGQGLVLQRRMISAGHLVRSAAVLVAGSVMVFQAMLITPEMNRDLRSYWAAAEAGDVDAAMVHRDRFEIRHPTAERLHATTFGLLLIAVTASAATVMIVPVGRDESDLPLQQPHLGKGHSSR